jgi:hypothetical protein
MGALSCDFSVIGDKYYHDKEVLLKLKCIKCRAELNIINNKIII